MTCSRSVAAPVDHKPHKTPRRVTVAITGKCNLRCHYCFSADEMVALGDRSTETWKAFFENLGQLGVMDVTLTGGEIFTRKDIFELIDHIIANRMRYTLISNGVLIDDRVIEELSKGKRKMRMSSIQISIDGSTPEVHDLNRPRSFTKAMAGLQRLRAAGFNARVRVTITQANLSHLEETVRYLLEDIGLGSISTNDAMPLGAGCASRGELALTPQQQLEAQAIMTRLEERYPGRLDSSAGPQTKKQMYSQMEHARATGEKAQDWQMGKLTSCGCIFQSFDVLHDGNLVPCLLLPDKVMGTVESDLVEIWQNDPTLIQMRNRRSVPMCEVEGCETCEWNEYCNGGCPGISHQVVGDLMKANPEDCYAKFLTAIGGEAHV